MDTTLATVNIVLKRFEAFPPRDMIAAQNSKNNTVISEPSYRFTKIIAYITENP